MADVSIRLMTTDDTDLIIKWRNSESVRGNFIYRKDFTREGHLNWIHTMIDTGKAVQYIILVDNTPVGSVYLRDIDMEKKEAEYGIFIGEDYARGRGVGTASAKLILETAFNELKLSKVFLRVLADNTQAVRSYEKAGFVKTGYKEYPEIDGVKTEVIFMETERNTFEKR